LAKQKPGEEGKDSPPVEDVLESLRPFPANPQFKSEPILPEEARHEIWKRVMQDGDSVREVSADLRVEMRRVGAVVRLMEIEKEWQRIVSFPPLIHRFPYHFYDDLKKKID
jgi:hypothetical protein